MVNVLQTVPLNKERTDGISELLLDDPENL